MTADVNPIPISVDYTDRDYYSLRNDLIARVQDRVPNWTGNDSTDFGLALIEAFAYMGDIVNYYIDRVANENYLMTATQRQSILNIAKTYGYTAAGYRASYITIQFTNNTSTAITIPAGTQVTAEVTYNDTVTQVIYTTLADAVCLGVSGSTYYPTTVSASQGEDVSIRTANLAVGANDINGEQIGISDGSPDQSFPLSENQVVDNSISVYVQNGTVYEKWTQVLHLADYGPNDAVYSVSTDADNYVYINFGDGVSGTIPTTLALIKAVYTYGGGTIGNIATGLVTNINKIVGYTNQQLATINSAISVTNTTTGVGGSDPENNDSVRANAPLALTTLNRAVTLKDYANLALSVSQVGKANATASTWNSVTIYLSPLRNDGDGDLYPGYTGDPGNGGVITPEWTRIQSSVNTYLSDKIQIGVSYTLTQPTYVPVTLSIQYVKLSTYTDADVQTNIKSAIVNGFSYNYVNFADVIPAEELEFKLRQVEGVDKVKVLLSYRTGSTAGRNTLIGAANEIFVFVETNISVGAAAIDATLSSLTSNTGTLSPSFVSTFTNYNLALANGISSITLTPTKTDSGASITVNGSTVTSGSGVSVSTPVGTTSISVVVTAADGTTYKNYVVNATRTA